MMKQRELDLNESMDLLRNQEGNSDVQEILASFEGEEYQKAVKLISEAKETFQDQTDIIRVLLLLELTSYLKLDLMNEAKESLQTLSAVIPEKDYDKRFTLGEMAYQLDLKLARRLMSQLVKSIEESDNPSSTMLGEAYLLLAEIEETMDKLPRAVKYYERGMDYLKKEAPDQTLFAFLLYKIGMLNSALRKDVEAITAFQQGLELSEQDTENKIHILVGLGKIYSSKNEGEAAFPYLSEALFLIGQTHLKNSLIHAETLTEIAYYYFDEGKVEDALPFYKQALAIYEKEQGVSNQKLGMIYMQYAYCLEHKETPNIVQASLQYEEALRYLEQSGNQELYESAAVDVISFFANTKNEKKKRYYENKLLRSDGALMR